MAGAILTGSVIVSIGVFAGLSSSGARTPAQVDVPDAGDSSRRPARVRFAGAEYAALFPPPPQAPAASLAELREKATRDAARALQADRGRYGERCGTPILRKYPGVSPGTFELNVAFDASGREIARGISYNGPPANINSPEFAERQADPTDRAMLEMHECLQGLHDMPLSIPAPGRNIDVTVSLEVP